MSRLANTGETAAKLLNLLTGKQSRDSSTEGEPIPEDTGLSLDKVRAVYRELTRTSGFNAHDCYGVITPYDEEYLMCSVAENWDKAHTYTGLDSRPGPSIRGLIVCGITFSVSNSLPLAGERKSVNYFFRVSPDTPDIATRAAALLRGDFKAAEVLRVVNSYD